jgi:hypothetical protein
LDLFLIGMPIGEAISGFVAEGIFYIVYETALKGLFRAIRSIYRWLALVLFGIKIPNAELERIKRIYCFKRVVLKVPLFDVIPKGTQGVVLEVIDERKGIAEFEKVEGERFSIGEETVFEVELKQLSLVRRRPIRRRR